jgi:ADP-heptose:LPS heptosyltransferase
MGWRRDIFEALVESARLFAPNDAAPPVAPKKIFVLRNNDIGDLLVTTPLFDALKRRFPKAEIIAGIGSWNREALTGNPNVSRILDVNAPWHNKLIPAQGILPALRYTYAASEAKALRNERADIGIDVLGSGFGSLLLMFAQIPYRLGVRGYAGGDSGAQAYIEYCSEEHVARQGLRFAELLGCTDLPKSRPQIFLSSPPKRNDAVVIAPGVGIPEKGWPADHFAELVRCLKGERIIVVGAARDRSLAERICVKGSTARNLTGKLTLRECFEIIGGARLVICNSSMAMHVAAAFRRPSVVVLGRHFSSASQHKRQWGYPESLVLGTDKDHAGIFTVEETAARVFETLSHC